MKELRISSPTLAPVAVVAVILSLCPGPASAQSARKTYRQGLDAVDRGDWQEVDRKMAEAIAQRAEERLHLTPLSQRPYVPHYYLGLARFELGDCAGALTAWDESRRQQVTSNLDSGASLTEKSEVCRRGMAARDEADSLVAQATSGLRSLEQLQATDQASPIWDQGSPTLDQRLQAAGDGVADLETRLQSLAPTDPQALEAASADATRALETIVALRGDADRLLQAAANAPPEVSRSTLDRLTGLVRQRLDETRHIGPYAPLVRQRRQALETLLTSATDSSAALSAGGVESLENQLFASLEDYERSVIGPPRNLYRLVEVFLAGDYEATLEASEELTTRDSRTLAHLHLIRAAALFALDQAAEEGDETLLSCRREIELARGEDPSLSPSPRLFSPRFIELFSDQESTAEPATE